AGNLGGQTLTPGLYKSTSTLAISSGDLTLDAQGDANAVFIFQMGTTLTTTVGRQVILAGGAKAANIFWQVGSSATLGTSSVFKGNILALTSITAATGAAVEGRLLARNGAVTLDANGVGLGAPAGAPATTFTDTPPTRGYWYYVVNITDPCNLTLVSNMSNGSLNYLLGDVTNGTTIGQGDDVVSTNDVSALGSVYGTVVPASPGTTAHLDIGPTMDRTPSGRPHPDDFIGFEDLIVLSMNFSKGPSPQFARVPAAADRDELTLAVPSRVEAGETFTAELRMKGAGNLQAVSTQLGWDPTVVDPASVEAGALALAQDGVVLSSGPGDADVAVLGRERPGLSGDGVIAIIGFRAKASGDPKIGIASVDARDRSNQQVDLSRGGPAAPLVSALAPASPNPFTRTSAFSFTLGKAGASELAVFSVDGRRVRTLLAGTFGAGSYRTIWDGTDDAHRSVKPGLYFVRLVTAEGRFNRTVVLMN
ncbi:MAG TPA: ice-binding family protein, partial [Gemmatimonadales bacterium]|nr:ice-binding family protein [Gemmatimonadales bacterium]